MNFDKWENNIPDKFPTDNITPGITILKYINTIAKSISESCPIKLPKLGIVSIRLVVLFILFFFCSYIRFSLSNNLVRIPFLLYKFHTEYPSKKSVKFLK